MRNQALRCRRQNRRRIPSSVRRTGHAAAALRFNNYPLSSQSQFVDGIVMAGVYTLFGLNFVAFKNPPNAIFIRKLSVRRATGADLEIDLVLPLGQACQRLLLIHHILRR